MKKVLPSVLSSFLALTAGGCASLNDTLQSEPDLKFIAEQNPTDFQWCMHRWLRGGNLAVEIFESGVRVQAGSLGTAVAVSADNSEIRFWNSGPHEDIVLEAIAECNKDSESFPYDYYGYPDLF